MEQERSRVIQEFVPGKQVTLAHVIANPDPMLYTKLGINEAGAIGILTLTPTETAIIAADIATKAAGVELGFLDRFTGSLIVVGDVSAVEMAVEAVNQVLSEKLRFTPALVTKS
ncbi:ethanolamine utilization microcompartment protein EutS [Brevibacillus porteri]|jgi:ethanolamine utilization protein EutS|uniref:BMC circularly permuted domain-containing protein n=5 Tax=Brevibacillus TaxID=55080 RepID=C0Z8H0_BREBN|nr:MULTISPECIES: BMC domain-containing protein [Bacillales]ATF16162.1 ethanolamine utilization microcompartment protein EutS [Brevibacillus brevis X23]MED1916540.1 BMC domain-containing protein [Bacillus thuringiensis]AWX58805.1 ethanolamine utilization microcompartment protein EutS [Brevibacillus brevis]EJL29416.1 ethanolamine utilization protein [Brevibacillus sp. BC25]KMZ43768.1 propanediol utilization protein [Bacillus sp. FJAT-27238]